MAVRIAFAQIDAKDDGLTGYSTCAPWIEGNYRRQMPATAEAYKTAALMEREYLTRLKALQDEIEAKYAPRFSAESLTTDYDVRDAVEGDNFFEIEQLCKDTFPGEEAPHYT